MGCALSARVCVRKTVPAASVPASGAAAFWSAGRRTMTSFILPDSSWRVEDGDDEGAATMIWGTYMVGKY